MKPRLPAALRGGALALSVLLAAAPRFAGATDRMDLPPIAREAVSEDGGRLVEVIRPEDLRPGLFPTVILRGAGDEATTRRELSYPIGPRFIFALNDGRAILVDEWLRRFDTENALLVLDAEGETLARISVKEILAAAEQDPEMVKAEAEFGPWLAGEPSLVAEAGEAGALVLPVGRARVALDLDALRLRRLDA